MKNILGLDLGTNSIGWSLITSDFQKKEGNIIGVGSRIIPMSQDILGKFDSGQSHSQTAERTGYRGVRRLLQRHILRRERLHRVLNILGFLPEHYSESIDFKNRRGQFLKDKEVKLNYSINEKGKHEFIFMDSFNEMVNEFEISGQDTKIPFDWTLYYLRKKALTQKISKEELAWIILNFNQKRGYYQLRGEDESDDGKIEDYYSLKVKDVKATQDKNDKGIWYDVILENDWVYRRQSKIALDDWIGRTKEFIVTTNKEKDGSLKLDKEGNVKRSFRAVDSEKDWIAIKAKTEHDIIETNETVGEYIYNTLLKDPTQKIRGKLVKTIERKFYKEEFKKILKKQIQEHSELHDVNVYNASIDELYPRNEAHVANVKQKGFEYLFTDDIIFYQRPLKSKKSTISGCQYETRKYKKTIVDKATGKATEEWVTESIKVIPKSQPLFQEFRLWQFLKNLKVFQNEDEKGNFIEKDITSELLKTEDEWVMLFDFLNQRKEVEQKNIIQYFISKKLIDKKNKDNYRWNYVEEKKYPSNETRAQLISRLKKVKDIDVDAFLTSEMEYKLWHIIYSVKDINEYEKAIENFAIRNNIDQVSFENNFKKFPPYKSDYGAYSEKALKKIVPLMRRGKYWNENDITKKERERAEAIIERLEAIDYKVDLIDDSVVDDDIPKQLLKSFINFKGRNPLQGLNTYQACYLVYDRHSEASNISQWKYPSDIDNYLEEFKQHSLRNPIVEQVVNETLRTVRDIWKFYGKGEEGFLNEIHIELGREMKNPADARKRMSSQISDNENTNQRIKAILEELKNDGNSAIKPYSPSQQEILKIYEEGVFQNPDVIFKEIKEDEVIKIRKNNSPSKAEIDKYKLWLEQGYISPYTGRMIPLSRLFTVDYQIEHIIPQSRYFDNSMSNKIICESEVNQLKDNQTGYEFFKNNAEQIIDLGKGKTVKLYSLEQYVSHCNKYFKKNRTKLVNLLSEDIPEGFINRQLNDSRYISSLIKGLLSNIVREENEKEKTSKNVIPVTGAITSKLKQDWGLNDKWNEIIAPRFKRLNKMVTKEGDSLSTDFGFWDKSINAFRVRVPDEISRGFNKKRIDHRHHALDALVIACCTRKHTSYLASLNAENKNYALRDSLLIKNDRGDYTKHFLMPWEMFAVNAKSNLEATIISFKKNLRVINKTNNKTWQWIENNGKLKKQLVLQTKGDNWAIRKPMHKETVSGKVVLKRKRKTKVIFNKGLENWNLLVDKSIKSKVKSALILFDNDIKKVKVYFKKNPIIIEGEEVKKVLLYEKIDATATRISLSEKFTRKQLESITDTGIHKILENHIQNYIDEKGKERFDLAFNVEGMEELNKNIVGLNNGKKHQPIYKVRIYEVGNKFPISEDEQSAKNKKYVEAAKGTNLFFAIYWNEEKKKREYETIPLNEIIEHQKQVAHLPKSERMEIPIKAEKGKFLFFLSPNDLVYVPTDEERDNPSSVDFNSLIKEQTNRVYKMVSCTGGECHFVPNQNASEIKKNENGTNSKSERIQEFINLPCIYDVKEKPIMIKDRCWKLKIDRLGNVARVI